MYVNLDMEMSAQEFAERAKKKGVLVLPEAVRSEENPQIMMNCANVAVEDYEAAVMILKECL